MNLPKLNVKFWMSDGDSPSLVALAESWWTKVKTWVQWIIADVDVETAPLTLVNLIGWERDVERYANEPESLYRARVKYALVNAKDSGSVVGFENIWERLELGYLTQNERISEDDWDVIELEMTDSLISEYPELLEIIIRKYGRTCRRYIYSTIASLQPGVRLMAIEQDTLFSAAIEEDPMTNVVSRSAYIGQDFENIIATI